MGKSLQNGKYIIDQELGRGGFGVTYRAINSALGQVVVVKTLNEGLRQDPRFATSERQFQNEAQRLARFAHPNIVRVNDFFVEDGLPYIVMDYIPGETLDRIVLPNHPLPETIALHYIRQVSTAVQVIHQNGLLHRDIKPQNLILQQSTHTVILIDFGIAREFTPGLTQTHTHLVSEGYAPIEQYLPQAKRSPATDIYGLAATLYTLLTAQIPIAATLRDRLPMTSPREANPAISAQVSAAIMRGMEMEPHNRPASVDEWLSLLPKAHTLQPELATATPGAPVSQIATVAVAPAHRVIETEPAPFAATPLAQPKGIRLWHIGLIGIAAIIPFGLGFALLSFQKTPSNSTSPSPTVSTPTSSPSPSPATAKPQPVIQEAEPLLPEPQPRDEPADTPSKNLSPGDLAPSPETAEPSPPDLTPAEPELPSSDPEASSGGGVVQETEEQETDERNQTEEQEGEARNREERTRNEEQQAEEQQRQDERREEGQVKE